MSWLGICQSLRLQLLKPSHLRPVAAVRIFFSLTDCSLFDQGSGSLLRQLDVGPGGLSQWHACFQLMGAGGSKV